MRASVSEPSVQVVDVGRAGLGKYEAVAREPRGLEHVLEQRQGAGFIRRHALATDERLRERDWVCWNKGHYATGFL